MLRLLPTFPYVAYIVALVLRVQHLVMEDTAAGAVSEPPSAVLGESPEDAVMPAVPLADSDPGRGASDARSMGHSEPLSQGSRQD